MKSHKKLVIVGVVIVVLAALATAWYIKYDREAARKTAEVVAVANQFAPPENWKITSEIVNEAKPGCIDVKCPSIHTNWLINNGQPTDLELAVKQIKDIGWTISEESSCAVEDAKTGRSCYVRGSADGYVITFTVDVEGNVPVRATLLIE